MRRQLGMIGMALLIGAMQIPAFAIDGKHINGRAVSVQWRWGRQAWGNPPGCAECGMRFWKGAINLFTITNGVVTATDTAYPRSLGYAYYPPFSVLGCSVQRYMGNGPCAPIFVPSRLSCHRR